MSLAVDVVKRAGGRPTESYDRDKLHASVVAACLSVRAPDGQAEAIARAVCDAVDQWLTEHREVTSHDLRRVASQHLAAHHPEAAYFYEQHRVIL